MKLYGVMVVQNEADVIQDTLDFLQRLNIYEAIFFYDLGSEDDTFARARRYEGLLHEPQVLHELYTNTLRFGLMAKHRSHYAPGDWVAIIDADEFYEEDPIRLIGEAEREGATVIKTFQAEFVLTDLEVGAIDAEDRSRPIYDRRRFYLIDWSEERFFKYLPDQGLFTNRKVCSRRLLNRHYPCRTPEQLKTRIRTRLENRRKASALPGREAWPQIFSSDWRDYLGSHRLMQEHTGGELRFGIPVGVGWKDYYSFGDPFSATLPQITTALMQERLSADSEAGGRVTFPDRYPEQVVLEVREATRRREWREALRGLLVLASCRFRRLLGTVKRQRQVVAGRCLDLLWNTGKRLRRAAAGKSRGSLAVHPNPIVVSEDTGVVPTTLRWSAAGTPSIEVRAGAPDGPLVHRGGPSGRIEVQVEQGVLFLTDAGPGDQVTKEITLARVTVHVVKGDCITI